MSNFLNIFFAQSIFWQKNFPFIFLLIRQASILIPSIRQRTISNIFKTVSSKSLLLILRDIPTNSQHSPLNLFYILCSNLLRSNTFKRSSEKIKSIPSHVNITLCSKLSNNQFHYNLIYHDLTKNSIFFVASLMH